MLPFRAHLTAAAGDLALPIPRPVHSTAVQALLRFVPGALDVALAAVLDQGRPHLVVGVLANVLPEHVAEHAAHQHRDEHDEHDQEVREQHALDLLDGADAAQEGDEGDQPARGDEDVDGAQEHVRARELRDEGLVQQGPHPDAQHHGAAQEYDEVGQEHAVLDALAAAAHLPADPHRAAVMRIK